MTAEPSDVVVVGGGIAGLAAALSARAEGASVLLLDAWVGASGMAGGAWDVASDRVHDPYTEPARAIDRALDVLARLAPRHPLAHLPRAETLAAIRDGHAGVIEALGTHRPLGAHADAEIVVSEVGLARRAALAQHAVLDLAPLAGARIAVAWMRGLRSFDGPFVAASLTEQAVRARDARRFVAIEVELFRRSGDALLLGHELASLLDEHDARERAASSLARAVGGTEFDAILLPPILGVRERGVRARLEAALGRPVGEAVETLAGSAQSLRTAGAIAAALGPRGIAHRTARVARITAGRVILEDGEELRGRTIVLATGKLAAGGIALEHGEPHEPLAGLPIHAHGRPLPSRSSARGRDPMLLFGGDPFAPGSGFTMGVGWDTSLRPLDAHGEPESAELFACGDVLDGAGPHVGSGLGTAVATGWIAGGAAARCARSDAPLSRR